MTTSTVARVRTLIARQLNVDPETIREDTSFEELGVDSFDGLEIAFELEEEFGVLISNERVTEFRTIRAICEGLETLQKAQPSG